MKKWLISFVLTLFLSCAGLFSCSDNNKAELEPQKGAIEKMTDQAAQKAINRIRTPLDKARSVADEEENRLTDMDVSVNDRQ